MRVLAARFPNSAGAKAALDRLRRQLKLAPPDADIAPLGTPGEASSNDTLLAGRFREDEIREVASIVRHSGGVIVADVDERWTQRTPAPSAASGDSRSQMRGRQDQTTRSRAAGQPVAR